MALGEGSFTVSVRSTKHLLLIHLYSTWKLDGLCKNSYRCYFKNSFNFKHFPVFEMVIIITDELQPPCDWHTSDMTHDLSQCFLLSFVQKKSQNILIYLLHSQNVSVFSLTKNS